MSIDGPRASERATDRPRTDGPRIHIRLTETLIRHRAASTNGPRATLVVVISEGGRIQLQRRLRLKNILRVVRSVLRSAELVVPLEDTLKTPSQVPALLLGRV